MEKLITLPKESSKIILAQELTHDFDGIILVYQNGEIIGSVVSVDYDGQFRLVTHDLDEQYDSMSEILVANPSFTFKHITK